jgi:hypothetical protein
MKIDVRATFFTIFRLTVGLLGAWWVLAGVVDALYAGVNEAWRPMATSIVAIIIGGGLAYGAFNHFPWERRSGDANQAT